MDSAQSNEDEPLPESEQVPALCVFVHSPELPPPCLPLKGPVIYPDLVWSGNISTSPLCWTETDTKPPPHLEAFVAVAPNVRRKTDEWCLFKALKNKERGMERKGKDMSAFVSRNCCLSRSRACTKGSPGAKEVLPTQLVPATRCRVAGQGQQRQGMC